LSPGSADPWCWWANGGDSAYAVVEAGGGVQGGGGLSGPRGAASPPTARSTLLQSGSPPATLRLEQRVGALPVLGPDVAALAATVDASCSDVFRLTLGPAAPPNGTGAAGAAAGVQPPRLFPVPPDLFASGLDPAPCPPAGSSSTASAGASPTPAYAVTIKHDPFAVHVAPAADRGDAGGAPLLDTAGSRLVVKARYAEWATSLHPASNLYGLGERSGVGLVVDRPPPGTPPRTIWARDRPASFPGENLYGAWPAWLEVLPSGSARGGLVLCGTALDVVVRATSLTFRSLSPAIDVLVFAGPTPAAVLDQLTRSVGRPALPPAFALGVHQSRWGYRKLADLERVVAGYASAGLPLDVIWSDIDHMAGHRVFTLAPTRYPPGRVRSFLGRLHAAGQRWVPILDPGIKAEAGYAAFDAGLAGGVFLRDAGGGAEAGAGGRAARAPAATPPSPSSLPPFIGRAWPGPVAWPDFVGGGAAVRVYWGAAIAAFHALAPFDGLWIDMNEPSNFNDGGGGGGGRPARAAGSGANPPPPVLYPPNNGNARLPLLSHTLPHTVVGSDGVTPHLDTHNLYGHAQAAATHAALTALRPGQRPFILTRSSFVGTGAYAAHWTGDNAATWADLVRKGGRVWCGWGARWPRGLSRFVRSAGPCPHQGSRLSPLLIPSSSTTQTYSIPGVLASGLVGIPMAGADVCGFGGDTEAELCARWVGAAALQPFFRDHSDLKAAPQELYLWADLVRAALATRTAILPALYSALARAAQTGAPAARPLWFDFPGEAGARADRPQWLVGADLMAAPCVENGGAQVTAWLPPGSAWVDVRPLVEEAEAVRAAARVAGPGAASAAGAFPPPPPPLPLLRPPAAVLATPLGRAPPVLLRCGGVAPLALDPAPTAEATLTHGPVVSLVACLGTPDGTAVGELWSDDGLAALDPASPASAWFDLEADRGGLNVSVRGGAGGLAPGCKHWPRLGRVRLVGGEGGVREAAVAVDACGVRYEGGWLGGVPLVCGQGRGGARVEWGTAAGVEK
jgi:alpha-glucosidase (family GH31 glycosyl hydrolase)